MRRTVPKAAPYPKCPVEQTLDIISGRWKCVVLFHLLTNPQLRFGELRRRLPGATQRMLTRQLRELERDHCVERRMYAEVPPRVEYSLTPLGRSLEPVVRALCYWGMEHTASTNDRDAFIRLARNAGDSAARRSGCAG